METIFLNKTLHRLYLQEDNGMPSSCPEMKNIDFVRNASTDSDYILIICKDSGPK
jgi:hypothetical protein